MKNLNGKIEIVIEFANVIQNKTFRINVSEHTWSCMRERRGLITSAVPERSNAGSW